jgi:hypothetical protein
MIIFTISLDQEADPILFSDPDPAPLKQIISDPSGSGSGSTTLLINQCRYRSVCCTYIDDLLMFSYFITTMVPVRCREAAYIYFQNSPQLLIVMKI